MIRDLGEKLIGRLPSVAFIVNGRDSESPTRARATLVHPKLPFEVILKGRAAYAVSKLSNIGAVSYGDTVSMFPNNELARIIKPDFNPWQHAPVKVLDHIKFPWGDESRFKKAVLSAEKKLGRKGLLVTFT